MGNDDGEEDVGEMAGIRLELLVVLVILDGHVYYIQEKGDEFFKKFIPSD